MKEWIEEQLADNRSISEIAREMGKSTRTIYQLCKDLKIKLPLADEGQAVTKNDGRLRN